MFIPPRRLVSLIIYTYPYFLSYIIHMLDAFFLHTIEVDISICVV